MTYKKLQMVILVFLQLTLFVTAHIWMVHSSPGVSFVLCCRPITLLSNKSKWMIYTCIRLVTRATFSQSTAECPKSASLYEEQYIGLLAECGFVASHQSFHRQLTIFGKQLVQKKTVKTWVPKIAHTIDDFLTNKSSHQTSMRLIIPGRQTHWLSSVAYRGGGGSVPWPPSPRAKKLSSHIT